MNETNKLEVTPGPTNSNISMEDAEGAVLAAFRQVLGLDEIDRDIPFAALGGDSMRAVRVLSRLWRELGVELPVHSLGNATTAVELAAAVREHAGSAAS